MEELGREMSGCDSEVSKQIWRYTESCVLALDSQGTEAHSAGGLSGVGGLGGSV